MADPVAVLVVPAEGDPGGLLAYGALRPDDAPAKPVRCGSVPPYAWRRHDGAWIEGVAGGLPGGALPLWWDGALVPEGWMRLGYVDEAAPHPPRSLPRHRLTIPLWPELDTVLATAELAVLRGLAARVVLLDRVDGRLVERAR